MRTFLAIAAKQNMYMDFADIETTFLKDDHQEDIYMRRPIGA
jgi:hypothetical protein